MDRGVSEGREDVSEGFPTMWKRKKEDSCLDVEGIQNGLLSRILLGGRDNEVLIKDSKANVGLNMSKEDGWMLFSEFDFEAKYHLRKTNVDVVPWNRKKE
ncbi:hypothetical protein Tco_1068566 [Tanacetum coccineum]|uniref:Uncharacterized protein n=1 Tax=Tanacetum coccineum TaxID=301880 RepID=A0ABQ5HHI2_9ASTR